MFFERSVIRLVIASQAFSFQESVFKCIEYDSNIVRESISINYLNEREREHFKGFVVVLLINQNQRNHGAHHCRQQLIFSTND